jgi:ribosomal protein S27AE
METNPGVEALRTLARMGYRFTVNGETIKAKYYGPGEPDPSQVKPMLEAVKAHKPEAIYFLKSYCPRCGGCCFAPDYEGRPLCLACDWKELVSLYPGLGETQ